MADTRVQRDVEEWVRQEWMSRRYNQTFSQKEVTLTSGGGYKFNAVSEDGRVVCTISTSGATTSGKKFGTGKFTKIRADMYFLLLAEAEQRVVVLTEKDMYERCLKESEQGRVPRSIEFAYAEIPCELDSKLRAARRVASEEVAPK